MPSLWTTALLVFAFFFAYYVYEPPYRGLYPDLLPERIYGRAQSAQHLMRGLALGTALIGGSALFHVWEASPFLVAAFVVVAACAAPVLFVREDGGHGRVFEGVRAYVSHSWSVFRREPDVRSFLIANTAWEGAFAGARTFVVLYLTVGLGQPLGTTTAVLAAVAGGYIVAAAGSGFLGDRLGLSRVIFAASIVYGIGLILGGFGNEWHAWYLPVIFVVAIAGGSVMTLAWGLLFKLMPAADRGAISGLATTTKGIGLLIGPLLAGAAIDLLSPVLEDTQGYQVLWPILGIPVLLVLPLVARLSAAEGQSGPVKPESPEPIV
jgi:Na+/melibiose symporter-like transporter